MAGGSNRMRYAVVALCLALVVLPWVAMAELLSALQKNSQQRPCLLAWAIHSCYSLALIPWAVVHRYRTRAMSCGRALSNKVALGNGTWKQHFSKTLVFTVVSYLIGITWYYSLPITSVSANTAIYNSSCVFVYIFSIFLIKETVTILKVVSVAVCVAGVAMVGVVNSRQGKDSEAGTPLGYILVVVSTIGYSLYEVLAKIFNPDAHGSHETPKAVQINEDARDESGDRLIQKDAAPAESSGTVEQCLRGLLLLGTSGLMALFLLWPVMVLVHVAGLEPLVFPTGASLEDVLINGCMDALLNSALLIGISLSSPLLMAVGSLLTIPVSIGADLLFHGYLQPPLSFVGLSGILAGFAGLVLAQYRETKAPATR